MYLSDAIDMGSLQSGQAFGCLADSQGNRCAWGGAYQAAGIALMNGEGSSESIPLDWGWAFQQEAHCPACRSMPETVETIIAHLNDHHKWTRPRIADWVRAQEIRFGIRKE